ncbi:bacterioferritin-associated ferredoxin [Dongia soli]|uniref:(2Fe-2S)-binding protein n=1 Tax=Dongia soli TaxID=600628 RepID=UPI00360D05F7
MRIPPRRGRLLLLTLIRILTIFAVSVYAEPRMYVCLCNGHRSSDIERVARDQNLTCPKAIYQALGGPVCCGTCLNVAQEIVEDVHAKTMTEVVETVVEPTVVCPRLMAAE